jgi:hypothetical protein
MPIGLAQNGDAKSGRFQDPTQDCHGEARMIDIGVTRNENDVDRIPAARGHLGWRHG